MNKMIKMYVTTSAWRSSLYSPWSKILTLSGVPQFFPILWLAGQRFFARHFKFTYFQRPYYSNCHVLFRENNGMTQSCERQNKVVEYSPVFQLLVACKKYHSRGLGGWVGADIRRRFPSYFPRKLTVRPSKMMIKILLSFWNDPFSGDVCSFSGVYHVTNVTWWVFAPAAGLRWLLLGILIHQSSPNKLVIYDGKNICHFLFFICVW